MKEYNQIEMNLQENQYGLKDYEYDKQPKKVQF